MRRLTTPILAVHPPAIRSAAALSLLTGVVLLGWAAPAGADITFGSKGTGAGQTEGPSALAADHDTGRLYVADTKNNRVVVYEANGTFIYAIGWGVADGVTSALQKCTTTCFKGIAGNGSGQFNKPSQIAVDNSGLASQSSFYVYDDLGRRVQKFDPNGNPLLAFGSAGSGNGQFRFVGGMTVGSDGSVYVGDADSGEPDPRIQRFTTGGSFTEAVALGTPSQIIGLAVDSSGSFYVIFNFSGGIRKFKPSGEEIVTPPYPLDPSLLVQTEGISVDPSDDTLIAAQSEAAVFQGPSHRILARYAPTGEMTGRFGYGAFQPGVSVSDIAPYGSGSGDVFAIESPTFVRPENEGKVKYLSLPGPGPLVVDSSVEAIAVGNTKATLRAEVNPEGKASEYHVDYVDRASFEAEGFAGPNTKSTPAAALPIPAGKEFNVRPAEAQIGCADPVTEAGSGNCLAPETEYVFRVVAANADGEDEAQGEFTSRPPLEVEELYATEAGSDSARIHAVVDPLGLPTTAHFEYVEEAAYQESGFANAAQAPNVAGGQGALDYGAGEGGVERSVTLSDLRPATTYRYRLIATDPLIAEPVASEERILRTFAAAEQAQGCANEAFRTGPSAPLPDCRAYELVSPLEKNNGDIIPLQDGTQPFLSELNRATPQGSRLTYTSYRGFGDAQSAAFVSQYLAARKPEGWQTHAVMPPRGAPVTQPLIQTDTEFKAFSEDLCFAWFRAVAEPPLAEGATPEFPNLYRRTDEECGGEAYDLLTVNPPAHKTTETPFPSEHYVSLELQGTSADGTHAVYVLADNIAPGAPNLKAQGIALYEHELGQPLRYACILPNGQPYKGACSAGMWMATPLEGGKTRLGSYEGAISADGERIFWTAALSGSGAGAGPIYVRIGASETVAVSKAAEALEGSSSSEYLSAARDGSKALFLTGGSLYSFDVDAEETVEIAPEALGVLGASEDASRVYLVSRAGLDEGATAGQPNLYLHEAGEGGGGMRFIATISAGDAKAVTPNLPSTINRAPVQRLARVTPDGLHAAFNSTAPLTGYDNADAKSGEADSQAFIYDAASEELFCASCNPTGARPVGQNLGNEENKYWAASILPPHQNALYAPRVLSEDGSRLYFESTDALTRRDTNGKQDVYQWQAPGSGSCAASSPSYSQANGGCIELISSGQSNLTSELLDAGPSGKDVFIATLSSLVPHDYGLVDVYDARVGGGFPPPPASQARCAGESCQSPQAAPAPPSPASLSYRGPGNLKQASKPSNRRCPKGKRAVRAKRGKARCAKAKRGRAKGALRTGRRGSR